MKKENKDYGIYFNGKIPKINQKNKYHKKVQIQLEGKAFLVERKKGDEVEKTEIENGCILKKEGNYEIEFTNLKNEIYHLQIEIETCCLFFILLFFMLGLIIGILLFKPINVEASPLARLYDYINLAILPLDIDKSKEKDLKAQNQYHFDVSFQNISSEEINLMNTVKATGILKNKIEPRNEW